MKSKVYLLNDEDFKELIKNHYSYSDCLRVLGLAPRGGSSSKILKRRIEELGCTIDHFSNIKSKAYQKYELVDVLIENSSYSKSSRLKDRLIRANLLSNQCSACNLKGIWNGLPIVLQLDHINGINNDNRLENLRILCPNCHSQTNTFAGKNKK